MIELTAGQAELVERIITWYKGYVNGTSKSREHPQWFAYSGAAGCGKTTVLREVIDALHLGKDYIGCAYTGKAVLQMLKNKLNAKTIHSLIYQVVPSYEEDEITHRRRLTFDFILKEKLDRDYRLIVVDEAPMVNDEIAKEILSFGIPVIFLGDMNQLPPVFGRSTIMTNPDFVLTQIMRQSEDNPIVQLSQMVLKDIPLIEGDYGTSKVVRYYELGAGLLKDFDQVLCTTNKLRANLNQFCREKLLGYPNKDPHLWDKVICRQNNWEIERNGFYLTNGSSGNITDINRDKLGSGYYIIDFHPDYLKDGIDFEKLKVDARYLRSDYEEQKNTLRLVHEKFEYAYAITVHLSQGSEYPKVLYIDSFFHDLNLTKKARYTAITRAMESITIVTISQNDWYRQNQF